MSTDGLRDKITVQTVFDDKEIIVPAVVHEHKPQEGVFRVVLCAVLFGAIFATLAGRLALVSFGIENDPTYARAAQMQLERPVVVDRNGRPLIMNRTSRGLAIQGRDVWDVDEAVLKIVTMFPDTDAVALRQRLLMRKYAMITDNITPQQRRDVIALGLPGLVFPDTVGRAYPQKDLAAHVVGYIIPGKGGATGVERALDLEKFVPAQTDAPIELSIDLVAQQVLEDELAAAMHKFTAKAAWGVLLDVKTGEVRALASLPDYNPNRPGAASDDARRNRVMSDVYELGSAFKPITAALAIDRDVVTMSEKFDVSQSMDVGGWTIKDYSRKLKPLTVTQIIQHSSNIGTVKIVQRLGVKRFSSGLAELGLITPMATELVERRQPIYSKKWRPSEVATASYGHGIAVTPLQLSAAFAATINGGVYRVPTFEKGKLVEGQRIFTEATSAQMRLILRKTVTDGTGRKAEVAGYYPIGKTATADKPQIGGYQKDGELVSSFIGAFPGYDPQYVLLVSLDEPRGTKETYGYATAGHVSAPIFRRVVERVSPPLGLMPVTDDVAFDGFVGVRRDVGQIAAIDAPDTDLLATQGAQ